MACLGHGSWVALDQVEIAEVTDLVVPADALYAQREHPATIAKAIRHRGRNPKRAIK